MKKHLETMQEIENYTGWNEVRIKKMAETRKFPLMKLEGRWMSTVEKIDEWFNNQLSTEKTT